MEGSIIIRRTEKGTNMTIENLNAFEVLGLLRFYEKQCWLTMNRQIDDQIKEAKKVIAEENSTSDRQSSK